MTKTTTISIDFKNLDGVYTFIVKFGGFLIEHFFFVSFFLLLSSLKPIEQILTKTVRLHWFFIVSDFVGAVVENVVFVVVLVVRGF